MSGEASSARASGPDGAPLRTLRILGMPVALQACAEQHNDELLREFQLIAAGQSRGDEHPELPTRLLELVEQLTGQYGPLTGPQERQIAEAQAAGHDTVDLTYQLPDSVADAARALDGLLDEADQFCREGQYLLTLASPPELVAFRQWFLSELAHQVAGDPPTSWADWERAHR